MVLDLAEAGLTRIEIRAVRHVVDGLDALFLHYLLHRYRLMYRQVVHEDGDPLKLIFSTQIEEILLKLGRIYRFFEDLVEFQPFLSRYSQDEGVYWLIYRILRYLMVYVSRAPVRFLYGLGGEDRFVEIYYSVMLLLQYADVVLNIKTPLFIFSFFIRINTFIELNALSSDLILHIELCQQCRVHHATTELTLK